MCLQNSVDPKLAVLHCIAVRSVEWNLALLLAVESRSATWMPTQGLFG
jgi:hypothetical protein